VRAIRAALAVTIDGVNADPVIAHIDRLIEEQREFMRELLARHERVTERLIRSLERTFADIQEEARANTEQIRANTEETRANTEETRAQTQAVLRLLDRFGPSDAPA
jgi:hypothetical protein